MEAADSRFDCAALAQGAMARASRWGFVGFVRGLAERGVKMRVMTAWAPAMEVEARRLAVLAEVRSLTLSKPARFFVRDGREALFFLTDDPSLGLDVPSEEAVRTTEAEDVRKLVETFEALWLVARPLTP